LDSVFIYGPVNQISHKMIPKQDSKRFYWESREFSGLKKIRKVDKIVIRKMQSGKEEVDTLYLYKPQWQKD
jgi:hypothetical protein